MPLRFHAYSASEQNYHHISRWKTNFVFPKQGMCLVRSQAKLPLTRTWVQLIVTPTLFISHSSKYWPVISRSLTCWILGNMWYFTFSIPNENTSCELFWFLGLLHLNLSKHYLFAFSTHILFSNIYRVSQILWDGVREMKILANDMKSYELD